MSAQEIAPLLAWPCSRTSRRSSGADWWRESAEIVQGMIPKEVAYRKAGGWWPVATARHVREICPPIIGRALRPTILQPDP